MADFGAKLGWGVLSGPCERKTGFVRLSQEEEALVLGVCNEFSERSKSKKPPEGNLQESLQQILASITERGGIELDSDQRGYLIQYCTAHAEGSMFLSGLGNSISTGVLTRICRRRSCMFSICN